MQKKFGINIIAFNDLDYKNDIDEVFSLTKQMDLVIACNSAPACFSGVLGIPTHILASNKSCDMLGTDDLVLTPSMKPVIQKEKGNWKPVIEEIAEKLKSHILKAK